MHGVANITADMQHTDVRKTHHNCKNINPFLSCTLCTTCVHASWCLSVHNPGARIETAASGWIHVASVITRPPALGTRRNEVVGSGRNGYNCGKSALKMY